MPASSPYQNNDYQALSVFRPYQLPVNDIFKAYSSLNAAWDQGAMGVKSAYENALQLNLVTDRNKERRDQFMEQATTQVRKMASMDLSNASVQREGINIFSPLMKDEDVIGEDYVVRNLNQEIAKGLSTRTFGDGKQWNPLSIENLQIEKSFLSRELNKRNGWKYLYQNMSTYSPYYDGTAELKKITDLVKAKEIEEANIKGEWYIETINKKGVSKERLHQAIQEMGSPQLKAQMRVEGRNTFYKVLKSNPKAVDGYFQGVATSLFTQKINDMKNNRKELIYNESIVPNTPENTKLKKYYADTLVEIGKQIETLQNEEMPKAVAEYSNLSNLDYLSANLSKVERLWESAKISQLAPQLAWESSTQGLKMNAAKAAYENTRLAASRIDYSYAALRQDQSQFESKENRLWFEALTKGDGDGTTGSGKGSGIDQLVGGGASSNGWVSTPLPAENSPEGTKANLEAARNKITSEYEAKDEKVRNAGINFLFGPSVQQGLEKGMRDGAKTVSEGNVLYENDIEDAANLILSYSAKHKITVPGQRQLTPFTSVGQQETLGSDKESIKQWIKSASPAQFRKLIGDIALKDEQFVSDWTIKKMEEAKYNPSKLRQLQENAINFRAAISENQRVTMTISENILKEQPKALGTLAKYFDNNGQVPLTDVNLEIAYERYAPASQLWVDDGDRNSPDGIRTRLATPQEIEQFNKSGKRDLHLSPKVWVKRDASGIWRPSKSDFINAVRNSTDPIYMKYSVDTNQSSKTITLPPKADRANELSKLKTIFQYQNSDNSGKIEKMLAFVESHIDNFNGLTVYTPSGKQKSPTIKLNMKGLTDRAAEEWNEYSNLLIPSQPGDKDAYQTRTLSSDITAPGSYVYVSPVSNGESPAGNIKIINQSRSHDVQDYRIYVDNVYAIDPVTKKPNNLTEEVIRSAIESRTKMPLEKMNVDELNYLLSQYLINVELNNKRIKEQK